MLTRRFKEVKTTLKVDPQKQFFLVSQTVTAASKKVLSSDARNSYQCMFPELKRRNKKRELRGVEGKLEK